MSTIQTKEKDLLPNGKSEEDVWIAFNRKSTKDASEDEKITLNAETIPQISLTRQTAVTIEREYADPKNSLEKINSDERNENIENNTLEGTVLTRCVTRMQEKTKQFYGKYGIYITRSILVLFVLLYGVYFVAILIRGIESAKVVLVITCIAVAGVSIKLLRRFFGRSIHRKVFAPLQRLYYGLSPRQTKILTW